MFNITLKPSGKVFQALAGEPILAAAARADIVLDNSCSNGKCGSCAARVVSGATDFVDNFNTLDSAQINSGVVLTCTTKAIADCEIEANYYPELAKIKPKVFAAKISHRFEAIDDVVVLKLRLPPTVKVDFLPGQYVDLLYNGIERSYSIANAPSSSNGLELHVRRVKTGKMSQHIFCGFDVNTLVRLRGPLGTFFVRDGTRPIVFLATGTGFSPVKAMVEDLLGKGDRRAAHIFWGAKFSKDIYSDLPGIWDGQYEHISYTPVFSRESNKKSAKCYVQDYALRFYPNIQDLDVYACGSPEMIKAAKKRLFENGLPESQFFADAFVSSSK